MAVSECAAVACITPSCAAGSKIQRTERPGSCCPLVQCVKVDNVWMNGTYFLSIFLVHENNYDPN